MSKKNEAPSRATVLFEAHKDMAFWSYGEEWFKKKSTLAKRLATQVADLTGSATRALKPEEIAQLEQAAVLLRRLGSDFEVSARHAKVHYAQLQAERAKADNTQLDALAEKHLPGFSVPQLVEYAEDVLALDQEHDDILRGSLGREPYRPHVDSTRFRSALRQLSTAGETEANVTHLRRIIADWIRNEFIGLSSRSMTWADWETYREHRVRIRLLLRAQQSA